MLHNNPHHLHHDPHQAHFQHSVCAATHTIAIKVRIPKSSARLGARREQTAYPLEIPALFPKQLKSTLSAPQFPGSIHKSALILISLAKTPPTLPPSFS